MSQDLKSSTSTDKLPKNLLPTYFPKVFCRHMTMDSPIDKSTNSWTREYSCGVKAESIDSYQRGTHYPVKLGQTFKNDRYLILHKIGSGYYATVWLAKANVANMNVALKFMNEENGNHELAILQHLRDSPLAKANKAHPGRDYVVQLLDDFSVNTSQICLVFELFGESIASYAECSIARRLPARMARNVMHQVALGLDYLWKCGIAHGDLYSGNILFSDPSLAKMSESDLHEYLGPPEPVDVRRRDGNPIIDSSIPPYLVWNKTLDIDEDSAKEIRIVDLVAGFFHDSPPEKLRMPYHWRAPEALLKQPLSHFVDMWSFGFLLFQIFTGRHFVLAGPDRLDALEQIRGNIGVPPSDWMIQLDEAQRENIINSDTKLFTLEEFLNFAYNQDHFEGGNIPVEEFEKAERELSDEELHALNTILSSLLNYQPESRETPEALSRSSWLERFVVGK